MPASTSAAPRDWLDHPALNDSVRELARRGLIAQHAKGTLLIQEGDVGDSIHVILWGRLRSFSVDAQSGREITYGIYGPGEYLGEMGLDGGPRSASVITLEPSVCALVRRATLEQYIAEHPAFAFELLGKVIRRARAATLTARQMALNDVYGRLKALLESLAAPQPDGTLTIGERLTHQDIAQRIGCTREMVSRVMRDLEQGGHVHQERGVISLRSALPARW
jgi:CRP/FNR family cyclic AMP-dependent transcriptional regulator